MKKIVFFILFITLFFEAYNQTQTYSLRELQIIPDSVFSFNGKGKILITQDQKVKTIVNNFQRAYKKRKIKGWRVQIYFVSGVNASAKARTVMQNFKNKYPDVPAYIEYEEPFFKVRVGDFLTKLEAAKFKRELENNGYSKVFLVEEKINVKR